ncbi:MAG: hypothetical protein GX868_18055, partial [Actinobacteria bacterium]|nr:hypothetical protein [Actinomycetota bacterium]
MDALWAVVRDRLERQGLDNRGRVRVPDLDAEARLTLKSLLGKSPSATVDLAALETALVDLGVGSDLAGSLAVLGHGVSDEPARRRKARALGAEARAAAHDEAQRWPETWAQEWVADVIRSGAFRDLDADEARGLVANVRRVLDEIDRHNNGDGGALPLSRVELAASVLGDSHLLDNGRRLEAAVRRALGFRLGPTGDDASVWALSGVHSDLT